MHHWTTDFFSSLVELALSGFATNREGCRSSPWTALDLRFFVIPRGLLPAPARNFCRGSLGERPFGHVRSIPTRFGGSSGPEWQDEIANRTEGFVPSTVLIA